MFDLTDRLVLVTGAGGGIGEAVCQCFRDHGAICFGADVDPNDELIFCDVTDENSISTAFDAAEKAGKITDVVHAAGTIEIGPIESMTAAKFRRVIEVNLTGSFLVAREAARRLPLGGTLTMISSQAGLKGGAWWSAYAASKGGVNRLTDCLAEELGPRGIRVNSICPGGVDTEMSRRSIARLAELSGQSETVVIERYKDSIPLGRFANPREIGYLCVFLASPMASYVHGTALVADGGELTR